MGGRYTGFMHRYAPLSVLWLVIACTPGRAPRTADPAAPGQAGTAIAPSVLETGGAGASAVDGGGVSVVPDVDAGAPAARGCEKDADCADALFCNGEERCLAGVCTAAPAALRPCPDRGCDEDRDRCQDCADRDHDSYVVPGCPSNGAPFDCDDSRGDVNPGAPEVCGDPRAGADSSQRDEDCNPHTCFHADDNGAPMKGDGDPDHDGKVSVRCVNVDPWTALAVAIGTDCDDDDPRQGDTETCDGDDNDCDGKIDEDPQTQRPFGLQTTYFRDADHDGAGDKEHTLSACSIPQNFSTNSVDCDDARADVAPDQHELCDGRDNDCNGQPDDAPAGEPSCPGARFTCEGERGWHITHCGGSALDCDGLTSNCCEVPIGLANCGACGKACGFSCAAEGCDEPAQLGLGGDHTCVITQAGVLACWGRNDDGQLGTGSLDKTSAQPTRVELAGPVHAVSGGGRHTCAIAGAARQLYCWGSNLDGQSGYVSGTDLTARNPQPVQGSEINERVLLHVSQVAAAPQHTCAVLESGAVLCWGQQANGRLGNLVSIAGGSDLPRPVQGAGGSIEGGVQVVVGISHSCALLRDHTVLCWGGNGAGQLGDGKQEGESTSALAVPGLSEVEALAAGPQHTCALSKGKVLCWGANTSGQLGRSDGAFDVPAPVPGVDDAVALAAGNGFTCALRAQGAAYCWGGNDVGQRGDGSLEANAQPTRVKLDGVLELATGYKHACARSATGVSCWGQNIYGKLGYETGNEPALPTPHAIGPLDTVNR